MFSSIVWGNKQDAKNPESDVLGFSKIKRNFYNFLFTVALLPKTAGHVTGYYSANSFGEQTEKEIMGNGIFGTNPQRLKA